MKRIFLALLCFVPMGLMAQSTLYFMDRMPQANSLNPAFIPNVRFHLGLPGMSGVFTDVYNSGFNYNDIKEFIDNIGDEAYDEDAFIKSIGEYNDLMTTARVDLLSLGFKLKDKGYFSFNIRSNTSVRVNAPGRIAYLIADYDDIDEQDFPLIVDEISASVNSYISVGFTYSRRINEHLTLGLSPHLNLNVVGAELNQLSYKVSLIDEGYGDVDYDETFDGEAFLGLPTEINPDAIENGELDLDEDLLPSGWEDDLTASDLFKNKSMSVDVGATYELNRWLFTASILNIGSSSWKKNGYKLNGNNDVISVQENQKIKIGIPTQLYLGTNNQFAPKWNAGILMKRIFYKEGAATSATVSLNGAIGRALSTSVSYTAGYSYNNLGLGLRLRFFPGTDLFVITDNLLQAFNYKEANRVTAAFGVNFSFGVRERKLKGADAEIPAAE